ncbi:MAG: heparinase II/III family protein [Pseudorhodoplanes sp.]|nr:heparinase II/III family protein [Pseudorhodoplanes sp.]
MPGGSIGERTRLSWQLARRGARARLARLNAHPLLRWRFIAARPDRLLIAPQDLRTADATRAGEIYGGRFAFAGKVVICDGRSAFEMVPPSDEWAQALLGFSWLRHLRAAESGITRANARALVDEWMAFQGGWHPIGWRSDNLSRRIMSWLSQAPLILHDADLAFYRRFMRSMTRQVRYLRRTVAEARDGAQRLQVLIALTYAALCMAGQARHLRSATKRLSDELDNQILPDGGHVSRNPGMLIDLLLDLLPLRQAFAARNMPPPQALLNAIDRMMPMLRFFRHGDGNFALFNGMGPTEADHLATILAYDDARGEPFANAPYSGYQRVVSDDMTLIVDTGAPPPFSLSHEAHAGCLSFELSKGSQRIVVNCGMPATSRESWRQVARATTSHSTAAINDVSSCRFVDAASSRKLQGMPITAGPTNIPVDREEIEDGTLLRMSHDGYNERFGIIHQRTLLLARSGGRLEGEDEFIFTARRGASRGQPDEFALRFHLHPAIKASRLNDMHGVMLILPNRDVWNFNAYEDRVEIEESVYLAGNEGPRRTVQIVIHGIARQIQHVRWTFSLTTPTQPAQRRSKGEESSGRRARSSEPELPL